MNKAYVLYSKKDDKFIMDFRERLISGKVELIFSLHPSRAFHFDDTSFNLEQYLPKMEDYTKGDFSWLEVADTSTEDE